MTSPSNTNVKVPHRRYPDSRPDATDYGVGMLPLTGRTVVISGRKDDGTPYVGRTLANCSYVPGRGLRGHMVVGLDVRTGQVRQLRLVQVESLRLRLGGPELSGLDLATTMEHHLRRTGVTLTRVAEIVEAA